jgi:hypothetical protein
MRLLDIKELAMPVCKVAAAEDKTPLHMAVDALSKHIKTKKLSYEAGTHYVNVKHKFSKSLPSGQDMLAVIKAYMPDAVHYEGLRPDHHKYTSNHGSIEVENVKHSNEESPQGLYIEASAPTKR